MKKLFALGGIACLLSFALFGCQKTAEGVSQDARNDTHKLAQATDKAAQNAEPATKKAGAETKEAAKNITAATIVTPKVKDAILADKNLDIPQNKIDVDSENNIVHLKGHVMTEAMKMEAGKHAQKALNDMQATDKLSNELTVKP